MIRIDFEGGYRLNGNDLEAAIAGPPGRHRIRSVDGWWIDAIKLSDGNLAIPRAMENAEGDFKWVAEEPWILDLGTSPDPSGTTAGPVQPASGQLGQLGGTGGQHRCPNEKTAPSPSPPTF